MQKSIKKALAATEQVYELIRKTAATGMTELELFSLIEQKLNRMGYKKEHYAFDFLSGARTSEIDGGATLKVIDEKDLLLVDFSLQHEGVWCDTCRTFFFGTPSQEQKEAYALLLSAMEAGRRAISPGADGDRVYRAVLEPIEKQNMKSAMPHHAGHGIGSLPFQSPVLNKDRKELLKPGDIVTLEPGVYLPLKWGMRIENDFLVTEEGARLLFNYPLDLDFFILE